MRKRDMNERALSNFIARPLCRQKRRIIGPNLDFCDFVGDHLSWTHFNLEGLSSVFVGPSISSIDSFGFSPTGIVFLNRCLSPIQLKRLKMTSDPNGDLLASDGLRALTLHILE